MVKYFMNFVILNLLFFGLFDMAIGGICWTKIVDGTCKEPIERNITKENCCAHGPNVGFTEKELTDFEYFLALSAGDSSTCLSCIESCKTAKCGTGKKCVIRNRKPKCVCAPNCKSLKIPKSLFTTNQTIKQNNDDYDDNKDNKNFVIKDGVLIREIKGNIDRRDFSQSETVLQAGSDTLTIIEHPETVVLADSLAQDRHKIQSNNNGHALPNPPNQLTDAPISPYFSPVCGTDGRTYKSECHLRRRACRREISTLSVAYDGECQTSCRNVVCPKSLHCLEDQNLMPHCVSCLIPCPIQSRTTTSQNTTKLVCGTDGKTYRNLCEIKRAACVAGRSIPVAYRGECNESINCSNIKCKPKQICLNDLITHRPRCLACNFKCQRKRKHQGKDVERTLSGIHSDGMKLCGRNNKTYNSWCQMVKDSCETGYFIDIQHNGKCSATVKR